jgi:carbon monoxide dehydrogenase subunit G
MIETDHSFVIDAPIGAVWAYASDIGNWASSMPGYESFEEVDELHSNWVLKVSLGALTRRVPLKVTITDRREPDHISFELRGGTDPVEGRGTFTAAAPGPDETSVVVSLAIWGSGPMAASMEAMSRPVVPRMTRAVSESFKNAVERSSAGAVAAQPAPETTAPPLANSTPSVGPTIRRRPGLERWRARLAKWTGWITRGARRTNRGAP